MSNKGLMTQCAAGAYPMVVCFVVGPGVAEELLNDMQCYEPGRSLLGKTICGVPLVGTEPRSSPSSSRIEMLVRDARTGHLIIELLQP